MSRPDGTPPRTRREARALDAAAWLPRGAERREPSPLRAAAAALRPWRRRLVGLLLTWVALAALTAALGLEPDVPVLLAILVAVALLVWHLLDHTDPQHPTLWPLVDGDLGSHSRGNDFRVANLAGRLEAADLRREGRESVVQDLHRQLQVLIRERLYARHGIVVEEEPRWAEGVTPPELWDLLVGLPPPDLYRPQVLDPILRRIEQW
ncbi:hypothetical protein GCM10009868_12930 [Terrabacter aerolatus]|uniref:Uncharacterized protein n=1 Tax=Terrabacter aerolatus TaxID=422442 RepID=A0A512CY58_9MICO|nr:hypothetical protein [Terrabacter aerolatus]GEO29149.1 hypothetical protein TAE01_09590 [Terrabacter aerolatus]